MLAPAYDVYLTGAKEADPAGHMRLIAAIAVHHRLPAGTVAAALEGEPCRVGARLPRGEAQALVTALVGLGAVARIVVADAPAVALGQAGADGDSGADGRRGDGRVTLKSAGAQPAIVDFSEPVEFAEPAPEGRTGVRGADTIRCPVHGLAYNRRQASGCLRCLAPARERARQLEGDGDRQPDPDNVPPIADASLGDQARQALSSWRRSLRDRPVRRAFWGLAVALVVGFVPAAYHARASSRHGLEALRAQQAAISAAPVTRVSLARFDDLDAQIRAAHLGGAGRALVIWLGVAGAAGAAWSKLT